MSGRDHPHSQLHRTEDDVQWMPPQETSDAAEPLTAAPDGKVAGRDRWRDGEGKEPPLQVGGEGKLRVKDSGDEGV
jgi:hypothetical protein